MNNIKITQSGTLVFIGKIKLEFPTEQEARDFLKEAEQIEENL
jgi:hypothetical protein